MATQHPSQAVPALELTGTDPVVFWGQPTRLRGIIPLRNCSGEKVKVRSFALEVGEVRGVGGQSASVSVAARVLPQAYAGVGATIGLDPCTKPGVYEGHITLGAARQPVRLLVAEHVDVRVQPEQAFIFTEGAREFEREFVFENAGNVAIPYSGECLVPLVDTQEMRTGFREALKQACSSTGSEDALKAVLCALAEQQVGPVSVRADPTPLEPGQIRAVRVMFHLPPNLRGFRKYVMNLSAYTAALRVEVFTGNIPRPAAL